VSAEDEQRAVCERYGAAWTDSAAHLKVGIARNVDENVQPLHGLRHSPGGDTTGWYIWAGDTFSNAPDFFQPVHVGHLAERCPSLLKFLGLPPGWRFLVAGDHVDVWRDPELLES